MSRLQQSWTNADFFSEPFYQGKYPTREFSVLSGVGHRANCPVHPSWGWMQPQEKQRLVCGGEEICLKGQGVGEGHVQIPEVCLSAQMPIVSKQVNNGKCLTAVLADY